MIKFRSTLAASSLLLLSAGAASAADLYAGPRGSLKDDTPINYRACSGSRFAGAYIGANIGVADLHSKWTETSADFADPLLGGHSTSNSGLTGGIGAGYNFVRCNFLVGIEGDYNFADVGKTSVYYTPDDTGGVGIINTMKDYATLRARMGFVVDRTLIYATGGLAWADLHHALLDNYPDSLGNVHYGIAGPAPDYSGWKLGWTVGGGFETALTDRISFKGEALYMDFGSRSYNFVDQGPLHNPALPADPYSFSNRNDAVVARVGLNIKLGDRGCDDCAAPLK